MSIKHALKQDANHRFVCVLPRRHNTRRNRERALEAWWNRFYHEWHILNLTPEQRAARNQTRIIRAQGLAAHVAAGMTLKRISSGAGVPVRVLTKVLDDYNHRQLPGQKEVA